MIPPALSAIGSKGIHGQDVGRRTQHAHGGHGGPEQATREHEFLSLNGLFDDHTATLSKRIRGNERYTNHDDWESCRLHAYRHAGNNIGRRASLRRLGNRPYWTILVLRVVLRNEDKRHGSRQTNQTTEPEVEPGVRRLVRTQQPQTADAKANGRQQRGQIIALVERLHRIAVFLRAHDPDPGHGGEHTKGAYHQGEEHALQAEVGIQRHPKNHRANIFRRGRFKQIGPTAGAIADVIPHQIGDDRRIAWVVFRDTRFNFADQVCPHISGLGVNATAKLRKQRHKTGAKAIANNQKGDLLVWRYQRGVTGQTDHPRRGGS